MISLYADSADLEAIRPYLKDIKYIVEDCYGYLNLDTIFVNLVFSVYRSPNRIRVVVPDRVISIGGTHFMVGARFNKADSNAEAIYMKLTQYEDYDRLSFRIIQKDNIATIAAEIIVCKTSVPYAPNNRILL